jgi:pimeloyl-ACP methyl ester carboxylesterase
METGDRALDLFLKLLFPHQHFDETTEEGKLYKSRVRDQLRNCHQLPREQAPLGFLGHFHAAMMHHCSYDKLNKIASELSPAKILVITGDTDELVLPKRSLELHQHLPGSELIVIKGAGHALSYQITEEFHQILDRVVEEGNAAFSKI